MSIETNLAAENKELKDEIMKLNDKLERCYNSKITAENIWSNDRSIEDKSGLGFHPKKKENS
jgi:hypothetical protein